MSVIKMIVIPTNNLGGDKEKRQKRLGVETVPEVGHCIELKGRNVRIHAVVSKVTHEIELERPSVSQMVVVTAKMSFDNEGQIEALDQNGWEKIKSQSN